MKFIVTIEYNIHMGTLGGRHKGRVPLTFSDSDDIIMPCPPHFFL